MKCATSDAIKVRSIFYFVGSLVMHDNRLNEHPFLMADVASSSSLKALSRRLDRCDRVIQNECRDQTVVMCTTSQCKLRSLRANS